MCVRFFMYAIQYLESKFQRVSMYAIHTELQFLSLRDKDS